MGPGLGGFLRWHQISMAVSLYLFLSLFLPLAPAARSARNSSWFAFSVSRSRSSSWYLLVHGCCFHVVAMGPTRRRQYSEAGKAA